MKKLISKSSLLIIITVLLISVLTACDFFGGSTPQEGNTPGGNQNNTEQSEPLSPYFETPIPNDEAQNLLSQAFNNLETETNYTAASHTEYSDSSRSDKYQTIKCTGTGLNEFVWNETRTITQDLDYNYRPIYTHNLNIKRVFYQNMQSYYLLEMYDEIHRGYDYYPSRLTNINRLGKAENNETFFNQQKKTYKNVKGIASYATDIYLNQCVFSGIRMANNNIRIFCTFVENDPNGKYVHNVTALLTNKKLVKFEVNIDCDRKDRDLDSKITTYVQYNTTNHTLSVPDLNDYNFV